MTRKRRLRPEERALWDKVAASAERLPKHGKVMTEPTPSPPAAPSRAKTEPMAPFRLGAQVDHHADHDLLPGLTEQINTGGVAMDRKAFGRLKRGKLSPEARIDLHGMTLERAHPALTGFILNAHAAGRRLVLVITGKGKARDEGGPIPTRFGVLRHQVPQWLRMPPLSGAVLQVTEAHRSHGGAGAYYVYLRRRR
ncbi:MAG: hypothetical protein HLUCCA08_03175 [Rhodobacteraceae bacterium HLUCCA08]|nr:MAG: hypothetical protein HLUCCA08_03175 [Rhodobacteraceae bacterium HLUCCA08]